MSGVEWQQSQAVLLGFRFSQISKNLETWARCHTSSVPLWHLSYSLYSPSLPPVPSPSPVSRGFAHL